MTPRPTKVALVGVLVSTACAMAAVVTLQLGGAIESAELAPVLWFLTVLFAVRIAGQVLVALRRPAWLPPMDAWNLVPYRALLPAQLAILGVMAWIDASFSSGTGPPVNRTEGVGWALVAFSVVYAGAMVVRYCVRMGRRPEARWFGGAIPIVFHLVLATYVYALGSFHVGS